MNVMGASPIAYEVYVLILSFSLKMGQILLFLADDFR